MKRRKFISLVGSSSLIALTGCADTELENNTEKPEFTSKSGEENLEDTDENINYPPGLSKNRIDIEEVMDNTPLLQSDTKPSSVSFKSTEVITENENKKTDRTINGEINIDSKRMRRNRENKDSYTERFKINNKLFKASFTDSKLDSVVEINKNNKFNPLSDSGYKRIQELVSPFDVDSHTIKKDPRTDQLVHFYTSKTSDSRLPVTELRVGFYENGLVNFINVYYTNNESVEYEFKMSFVLYDKTSVPKPDWYSKEIE